jgi:hypothetical protein
MHENSYGQKEHAFRAKIARLPHPGNTSRGSLTASRYQSQVHVRALSGPYLRRRTIDRVPSLSGGISPVRVFVNIAAIVVYRSERRTIEGRKIRK